MQVYGFGKQTNNRSPKENGKRYATNFWFEQDKNSPHLYESGDYYVREGDVIVDAGACEGNFTLHNIDKVSKVYVIECNEEWLEALKWILREKK